MRHNLVLPRSPLLGRSDELAEVNVKQRVCARLHAEYENMGTAVAWCAGLHSSSLGHGSTAHPPAAPVEVDKAELALRLAGALSWYGLVGERLNDVSRLLEAALQLAGGSNLVRAKALWGAGHAGQRCFENRAAAGLPTPSHRA